MYLTGDARDGMEAAVGLPPLPVPGPRHRVQRLIACRSSSTTTAGRSARSSRSWRSGASPWRRRGRAAVPRATGLGRRRVRRRRLRGRAAGDRATRRWRSSAARSPSRRRAVSWPPDRLGPPAPDVRRRGGAPRGCGRWPIASRCSAARCDRNQVYLTDGVARHFRHRHREPAELAARRTPSRCRRRRRRARPPRPADLPPPLRPPRSPAAERAGARHRAAHRDGRVAHPWLRDHCVTARPWRDLRTVGAGTTRTSPTTTTAARLDVQAGHGTFISGIIRQQCPDARIHHRGVLSSYGDGDDVVGHRRHRAGHARPSERPVDIVVMSFGTYADDRPPPMATRHRAAARRQRSVVAAAGNNATSPAVLPGGAPRCRRRRRASTAAGGHGSPTSARGSTPARRRSTSSARSSTTSTIATDDGDAARAVPRAGRAWSGTSFAAPKVAGVIAQELYLHGGTAHEAWDRMRATGRLPLCPTSASLVNVLIGPERADCTRCNDGARDRRRGVVRRGSPDPRDRLDREAGGRARQRPGSAGSGCGCRADAELDTVRDAFDLPELAIADARHKHDRPKVERHDDCLLTVVPTAWYVDEREEVEFGELFLYAGATTCSACATARPRR